MVGDEGGEHAGVLVFCGPKFEGEGVVAFDLFGEFGEVAGCDAEVGALGGIFAILLLNRWVGE